MFENTIVNTCWFEDMVYSDMDVLDGEIIQSKSARESV